MFTLRISTPGNECCKLSPSGLSAAGAMGWSVGDLPWRALAYFWERSRCAWWEYGDGSSRLKDTSAVKQMAAFERTQEELRAKAKAEALV